MNRAERRAANKANQKRFPDRLTEMPRDKWPGIIQGPEPVAVFVNKKHFVQLFNAEHGITRMSVNRINIAGKGLGRPDHLGRADAD